MQSQLHEAGLWSRSLLLCASNERWGGVVCRAGAGAGRQRGDCRTKVTLSAVTQYISIQLTTALPLPPQQPLTTSVYCCRSHFQHQAEFLLFGAGLVRIRLVPADITKTFAYSVLATSHSLCFSVAHRRAWKFVTGWKLTKKSSKVCPNAMRQRQQPVIS